MTPWANTSIAVCGHSVPRSMPLRPATACPCTPRRTPAAFFPRLPALYDGELPSPAALLLHALALADAMRPQAGYLDASRVLWEAAAPFAREQPLACASLIDAANITLSKSP